MLDAGYSILDAGCSILDDLHLRTGQNVIEYPVSNIEYLLAKAQKAVMSYFLGILTIHSNFYIEGDSHDCWRFKRNQD